MSEKITASAASAPFLVAPKDSTSTPAARRVLEGAIAMVIWTIA
ncbi:hypothetical protein [Azospirillum sp. B4]|nr:hypothetical protein [Azospirillum sp. B4]